MQIGTLTINSKLALAPMAGVTDAACRQICSELGAGLTCTELVSAKALCYQDKKSKLLLKPFPGEKPFAAQIFGSDISCMAEAAQIAIEASGADILEASNVMAGNVTTLPITLDQMIYHGKSVMKGVSRALVVVDLPFGSYQGNSMEALASAIRIMKESHAEAVKIEGGSEIRESVERILSAGIPVMGHLGTIPSYPCITE